MKKPNYITYLLVFCLIVLLSWPSICYGQLNGNYTINPRISASSSNYQNWASAVGDLVSGNRTDGGTPQGAGVSGPVTITVYDTTYNSSVEIAAISGTSYANKIVFKSAGGDSTKCKIRVSSSTTSTNDFVLFFNGADYVTFQEIGLERTGTNTYSTVVQIANDADNNRLVRCLLKGRKVPSSSGRGFTYGISSMIYFKGNGDSTEITQNRLMYGYNGIYDTIACAGNTISGNIIDTSGSSGIYMTVQSSLRILGNTFNMGDFGPAKGHYTSYGFRIESSPSLVAANNKIYMSATNGQVVRAIVIAGVTSPSTAPAMVYNNMVLNMGGTTECTGVAVYGCSYLNIYFNNFLITNSLGNASAYYHYAPPFSNSYIRLVNNNLINKGGGYAINIPGANTGDLDTVDYNNVFTNGSNVANWGGTNCSKLSDLKSTSGKNANSISFDPGYTSNSNLHVSNIKLNGMALFDSRIDKDIDGDTRDNSNPDIGADEFYPGNIDVGVTNLDSPILFCSGKQIVKISFQNYGFDTIKSAQIQWQINGSSQSAHNWSGTLPPGSSSSSIALGNFTFSANTSYTFKIWTRIPNNKSDEKNNNDTLKITRLPAMAGTYTIGDTSVANFKSFNQAITAMTSRGICSAITFNVFKGTYPEQLTLVQLPGMGSANPITFQNMTSDSTKVLITLSGTTATGSNNAAVQLRGANYVTFKGISFERTGASTNIGHVIHILNGAHHNTFSHCQMLGLMNGTTSGYNIWSDQSKDDYNEFRSNHIRFGNNNIQFSGTSVAHEVGNIFEGNVFENGLNNSVFLQFNDSVTVKGNIFLNVNNHIAGNYDLLLQDCDKGINVNGNFFQSSNLDTSLWLNGCNATSKNNGIIANNSITRSYGKGIVLDGIDSQNVVFNSIYFKSNLPDNISIYSSSATSSGIVLKNNNIVMLAGEVFHITTPSYISSSDNNNLNSKGTQYAYWGSAVTNLPGLMALSGMDSKSLNVDPLFISSNLHIKNYLLKGKAQSIAGVTTDFDGETRNATKPDIGADEFKLSQNDAGIIAVIKPAAGICAGVLDVSAVIKNFGGDSLKSAIVNWSVNGNAQSSYNWSGNLATNATDTFIVGSYDFTAAFNPKFIIKATLPNGNADAISFNDSIIITRSLRGLPVANAGQDITICLGDSVIIGPGASTGLSYKWTTISNTVISNTSEVMVKPKTKTKYILEVTSIAFGCINRDTIEVGVNNRPLADAGNDKTICPENSVQIGSSPQSGYTYSWTSLPKGFNSSSANPTVNPLQTTTYIIEKTVTGSGCNDFDTVKITVASVPIPKITGKDNLCESEKQNYSTSANSGSTYQWIINGGSILSGQNTNAVNVKWNSAGVGVLDVIETNASQCFDTTSFYVIINSNPIANYSLSGTCMNSKTTFTNLSTGLIAGEDAYTWTFGDGATSSQKNPLPHIYTEAITYNVRLIAKNTKTGCSDTITKLLPIDPLPIANFTYVQKPGNTLDFTNTSSVSSGTLSSYTWKFGDGNDSSVLKDPSHKFPSSANYSVTLCAKSLAGCETCTTKVVGFGGIKNILPVHNLSIYPNPGSGIFTINSSEKMVSVVLSNRLGQTIKTFNPLSKDYTLVITDQPNGVYFVKIDFGGQSQTIRLVKE